MTERGGYDDEALLADLGEAWRDVAPVAAALTTRAQAAFSWRTVDADLELAALHFDSAAHSGVSSRAPEGAARVLVFSSTPLTVELEVLPDQHEIGVLGRAGPLAGHRRRQRAGA